MTADLARIRTPSAMPVLPPSAAGTGSRTRALSLPRQELEASPHDKPAQEIVTAAAPLGAIRWSVVVHSLFHPSLECGFPGLSHRAVACTASSPVPSFSFPGAKGQSNPVPPPNGHAAYCAAAPQAMKKCELSWQTEFPSNRRVRPVTCWSPGWSARYGGPAHDLQIRRRASLARVTGGGKFRMDRDSKRRFGCRRERQIPATVQSIGLPCACWRTGPRPSPSSHRSGDPGLRPMPFLVQPSAGTRTNEESPNRPKPDSENPDTRGSAFHQRAAPPIFCTPVRPDSLSDLLLALAAIRGLHRLQTSLPPDSRQRTCKGAEAGESNIQHSRSSSGCASPASERAPRHPDDLAVDSSATGPRDQISRRMITDQMAFSRLDPSDTLDDRAVVCRRGEALSCTAMPAAPGHRDRAAIENGQPHQLAAYADDCAPLRIKAPPSGVIRRTMKLGITAFLLRGRRTSLKGLLGIVGGRGDWLVSSESAHRSLMLLLAPMLPQVSNPLARGNAGCRGHMVVPIPATVRR